MPLKAPHTGPETKGRKTPQRSRLSDISNITPVSYPKHRDENHLPKQSGTQPYKDLATLNNALAEKEEIIKTQKVNMEKLWTNYTLKTKQNEDIIRQNARLYKELMQARDKLKILQHESAQMAASHRIYKAEMQAKLAKALEQADFSQQKTAGPLFSEKAPCDKQAPIPNVLTKLAESRARRTVSPCEASNEPLDLVKDESLEHPATCRSTLRRRTSLSYKEPSLKLKLRQPESTTPSQKPCISRRNRQVHRLHKLCEEEDTNIAFAMTLCTFERETIKSHSACQATSSNVSSDWSPLEEPTLLSSHDSTAHGSTTIAVSEESPNAPSATHLESGEHQMHTIDPASSPEDVSRGRPFRRSVSCINSYKEAPLNTKMRRPF